LSLVTRQQGEPLLWGAKVKDGGVVGWIVVRNHLLEHLGQAVGGVDGRTIRAGEDADGEERAINQRVGVIKKDGLKHGAANVSRHRV